MLRASVIFVDTLAGDLSMAARAPPLVSSAVRRRERRLRSFWRHEQMAVQMALATVTHHSFQVGTAHDALRSQKPVTSAGGMRPPPLVEGRPQERIQQHTVELMIDVSPYVQIFDAPVSQVEDHALEFFRRLDLPVAEQVIDVPKISSSSCPSRAVLNEPQVVEQLVEVPTLLSVAVLQQRTAEQSSTAISSSGKRISERTVEQIVDISLGGGLGHGSSSSAGPADEDFTRVFRTFPQREKSATRPPHSGSALPPHSSPWTPPAYDVSVGRVEEQAKRWQETQQ